MIVGQGRGATVDPTPRVGAVIVAGVHLVGACAWWSALAGGFPLLHRMSVANRGIPLVIGLVALGSLVAARRAPRWTRRGALVLAGLWFGIAGCGAALFRDSNAWVWAACAGVGVVGVLLAGWRRIAIGSLAVGVGVGVAAVAVQRAAPAATRPLGTGPEVDVPVGPCDWDGTLALDLRAGVQVHVNPLLVFESVSQDRFWTVFAGRWWGAPVRCEGEAVLGGVRRGRFVGEGRMVLAAQEVDGELRLDAGVELAAEVYSHLNHFLEMTVTADEVSLAFAGCAAVVPSRPDEASVFAYVEAGGELVVARASSREKGPFAELCRTKLKDGLVAVRVHVRGEAVAEVELRDWAAQVDTTPSPTAGWGVPGNAIEFWSVPGAMYLVATLAGTSVGRGFHSVGHAAGRYRNRVVVRRL